MNRKSIIISVAVIGLFLIIVAVALFFLYSGTGSTKSGLADKKEYMLFSTVPLDACAVMKSSTVADMTECLVSEESSLRYFVSVTDNDGKLTGLFHDIQTSQSLFSGLLSCPAILSIHDLGDLEPLLTIDAGRSGELPSSSADSLMAYARKHGLTAEYTDISDYASSGSQLKRRSLLMISTSDILVKSSLRHIRSDISILDIKAITEALGKVSGNVVALLPEAGVGKIAQKIFSKDYRNHFKFAGNFAGCTAFTLDNCTPSSFSISGKSCSDGNSRDFMNVFASVHPSNSKVSSVLPSYTISAATVPVHDITEYTTAYLAYSETLTLVKNIEAAAAGLKKKTGLSPIEWASAIGLKEVASASFSTKGKIEKILLVNIDKRNAPCIFKGNPEVSADNCSGKILNFAYSGFLSHLFGKQFSTENESRFIMMNDWMIIGSTNALMEYTSGRATHYCLAEYLADTQVKDGLSVKDTYFSSYLSLTEDFTFSESVFSDEYKPAVRASAENISFEPVFFSVRESKSGLTSYLDLYRTVVMKSQAPAFERETKIEVSKGPFRVKNSGTGKMNLFYQQENMYLCLQEENGKGLWGVPFQTPICGTAQTVDFYANDKLQILFASGSKLYLIDRLGRFVSSFPVELGREVLLGPEVYDFSGKKKYNVMVLHTDNTIEMYNLQGKRPAEWKTITAPETIIGLPERIRVGGSTYWVVRTSIQTLIFGFYGGEPLTNFSSDKMIRPDSEVTPSGDGSVDVLCYDGKRHTVKLTGK